ncbi:hypothetical protein JOM56_009908 [Amanita muscaria]
MLFTALLFYDYTLTFPDEMKYIWGSKLSLSTFLYIGCRYALVANVIYMLAYLNIIHDRVSLGWLLVCDIGYKICGVLGIIGRASVLSVWGLRTYALYNGSKVILVWFVSLGLACLISDVVHAAGNRCNGPALYPQDGEELGQLQFARSSPTVLSSIISEFGEDLVRQQQEVTLFSMAICDTIDTNEPFQLDCFGEKMMMTATNRTWRYLIDQVNRTGDQDFLCQSKCRG